MKILITQFSAVSCHLHPLGPNISLSPVFWNAHSAVLPLTWHRKLHKHNQHCV
jgi:hypothetical protein